jgi:hypothetical protein
MGHSPGLENSAVGRNVSLSPVFVAIHLFLSALGLTSALSSSLA